MNNVILSGRLASECEPFYTDKGLCIARFTIVVQRPSRKRKEEDDTAAKENCDFIDCVAFGKQGEAIANFIHKGKRIFLSGRLQVSSYINKEGKKVFLHQVIVSNFEYVEPKDKDGESTSPGSFADFGIEDIEF